MGHVILLIYNQAYLYNLCIVLCKIETLDRIDIDVEYKGFTCNNIILLY